jgi:eukaryotic-like serine/threonine-protein kinase
MNKKILHIGIFVLFVMFVLPPASSATSDWWPCYRHDPQHTGNTSSPGPLTNTTSWTFNSSYFVYSEPSIVDDRIYFGTAGGTVFCLNAITGEQLWNFSTGKWITATPTYYNGTVIFNSQDDYLYCLNANTGSVIWKFLGNQSCWQSPTVVNGMIYFGSTSSQFRNKGVIYCISADNGKVLWTQSTKEWAFSSPAYLDGRIYIGAARDSHIPLFPVSRTFITCLNATTGTIYWKKMTGINMYWEPPLISLCGNRLFYSVPTIISGKVACLDTATGDTIWRYSTVLGFDLLTFSGAPTIAYGKLYFQVDAWSVGIGQVRCIDATTGKHIWTFKSGAGTPSYSNGKIYFGTWPNNVTNGSVFCLNAVDGTLLWQLSNIDISGSPSIANGRMYIGTFLDKLLCFS